jgi:hypothetical protein
MAMCLFERRFLGHPARAFRVPDRLFKIKTKELPGDGKERPNTDRAIET